MFATLKKRFLNSDFCQVFCFRTPESKSSSVIYHIFYYVCIVLATTIMPIFVEDPGARTIWFIVFMLIGSMTNALLGPGAMAWHIHFVPEENDKRNIYFSFRNMVGSVVSTAEAHCPVWPAQNALRLLPLGGGV